MGFNSSSGKHSVENLVIVGSGPAGYTAAIYTSRAGLNTLLYKGDQPGGQLTITSDVENYPGYPNGVLGPQMMEDFENQAGRFGAQIRGGMIKSVDFSSDNLVAISDDNTKIIAKTVIISTGASAKWLNIESEQRLNGKGVSACAVCDGFFFFSCLFNSPGTFWCTLFLLDEWRFRIRPLRRGPTPKASDAEVVRPRSGPTPKASDAEGVRRRRRPTTKSSDHEVVRCRRRPTTKSSIRYRNIDIDFRSKFDEK